MHAMLDGLRVIDLSSVLMGPMATQLLADHGAEVIAVEGLTPSTQRVLGPGVHPELSGIALNLLRNKRSVALDLRSAHGRRALLALAASADVLVTNLRPASLARLGIGYEDVVAVAPEIVWCEAHGFSSTSDDANEPAYDDIVQAATGVCDVMARVSPDGAPAYVPTVLADKVCAYAIAQAVLAGVVHRLRRGGSVAIEVSMVDVMKAFMLAEHGAGAILDPPVAPAGYQRAYAPSRRPFRTADGYLAAMPYGPQDWRRAFDALGRPDLASDTRLRDHATSIANAPSLYELLAELVATRPTTTCRHLLASAGVACAVPATLDSLVASLPVVDHPDAGAYRHIPGGVRVRGAASPDIAAPRPAPCQGADTEAVLNEIGLDAADLAACLADLPRRRR